jgi:CheY-like chemotaxis protein
MSDYVLVVDDHPEVRRLIIDVLSYLKMEGRAVGSGEEAIATVQSDPPLAIVLDLMMPGMDGFSTITRLHKEAKGNLVPIILLSAIALDDERLSGLPGVVSVIRKDNFTVDTFGKLLERLLKNKPAAVSHLDEEETPVAKLEPEAVEDPDAEPHPEAEANAEAKPVPTATGDKEAKPVEAATGDEEAKPTAEEAKEEESEPAPVEAKDGQAQAALDEPNADEEKPALDEA